MSERTVLEGHETLECCHDTNKTKEMWERAVEKVPFIALNVLDKYKIQKMCEGAVEEDLRTFKF